jgi:hypothetical protein
MGVGGRSHAPAALPRRQREPVPIVHEAWWVTGSLWTAAKNLPTLGFDPQAVQPVLQSLYRLRYPSPQASSVLTV